MVVLGRDRTCPTWAGMSWSSYAKVSAIDIGYIDGLVQERRQSSALAMELQLCCTNPSILDYKYVISNSLNTYFCKIYQKSSGQYKTVNNIWQLELQIHFTTNNVSHHQSN